MTRPKSTSGSSRPNRPTGGRQRPKSTSADNHQHSENEETEKPEETEEVAEIPEYSGPPLAIHTIGLGKSYGDAPALVPLDLQIAEGERVSLIGHNGSGKTTLIRMLTGMLEPSEGTATVAGYPIASLEARAAVSYLSDQPVFYDDLTVWEHLEYIARLHGTEDWEQQAVDLIEMVGLTPRADDLPMTFSRGLKQKAAITMAFVRPFELMLIDEPFVGLDRTGRKALLELLSLAHDDGAALVIATHELSSVREGQRLIALSGGEVTYDGAPDEADVNALTEGIRLDEL
jgi:ABC-type multidrug transport system ATPase subunit